MADIDELVARILSQRQLVPKTRSLLVGVSGIDGSGKGFVTQQLTARLALFPMATASINIDGWLNLPDRRFNSNDPANHFYENAIRFDDLFSQLIFPLREKRSVDLVADFAEETARRYRKQRYCFRNVDIVLVEGIFLFKRSYRKSFDLAIWVDCSFSTALSRALKRKQEDLTAVQTIRAYDTIYFPAQTIHAEIDNPRETADLIFGNDPYFAGAFDRNLRPFAATASRH